MTPPTRRRRNTKGGAALPAAHAELRTTVVRQPDGRGALPGPAELLQTLTEALARFAITSSPSALAEELVAAAAELTGSEFGLVADVVQHADEPPRLAPLATANLTWSDALQSFFDENVVRDGRYRVLHETFRRVRVSGDWLAASQPCADRPPPEGLPAIESLLVVQVRGGETGLGVVVLANRRPGYGSDAVAWLRPLLTAMGAALASRRIEAAGLALEEELCATRDAAQAASRAKSDFLDGVTHEVRTPMTAIVGYADLLLRSPESDAVRPYALAQIRDNANKLLGLFHEIMDLGALETGRLSMQLAPTAVTALLADALPPFRAAAAAKGLTFAATFPTPLPVSIRTDGARLRQVVRNLVDNAVKFTDRGGVVVRTDFVPGAAGGGGTLRIAVVDTGIGIVPERIPELFSAFTQVHDTRSHREGGTGLGLAVSRNLAQALGGDVTVESWPAEGSCFTLTLPVAPQDCERMDPLPEILAQAVAAPSPPKAARLDGRLILVVDDNQDNRRIMRYVVEDAGGEVRTANDGEAGVEAVMEAARQGRAFDAVLMDLQMPKCDGFMAAAILRSRGVLVPIVAVSAFATPEHAERAIAAGCDAHVPKPIAADALLAVLDGLVRRADLHAKPASTSVRTTSEGMAALARDYVAQLPDRCAEIRAARAAGDSSALRTLVHRLRGTGANLGFPAITQEAGRAEDLLRSGRTGPDLDEAIESLLRVLAESGASGCAYLRTSP